MLPLVASSLIEMTTFVLDNDDVNRLQLSFTCFLSFTFFISMLTENLPKKSGNMPLLLVAVGLMVCSVCVIIILQAIIFYLATSKTNIAIRLLNMEQRLYISKLIDKMAVFLYLACLIVSQVCLPIFIYFVKQTS